MPRRPERFVERGLSDLQPRGRLAHRQPGGEVRAGPGEFVGPPVVAERCTWSATDESLMH